MSYYGQGDYYARGGLFDIVKGIGKAAIGFATGGPLGAVRAVVPTSVARPAPQVVPVPGPLGAIQRALPGGKTGLMVEMPRKRRRMNAANAKALRRANRRVDGFVRLARQSLKHTNYKLVSKSAGRGKGKPSVIVETGPGGVRA